MRFHVSRNFKVEDGKIIAYDNAGNRLFSRTRAGETADIDEALEYLLDQQDTAQAVP